MFVSRSAAVEKPEHILPVTKHRSVIVHKTNLLISILRIVRNILDRKFGMRPVASHNLETMRSDNRPYTPVMILQVHH